GDTVPQLRENSALLQKGVHELSETPFSILHSTARLRQQAFHHFAIFDDFDRPGPRQQRLLIIDPKQVINRRCVILDLQGVIVWLAASRIRSAIDAPLFNSTSSHHDAEHLWIMVASSRP